MIIVAAFVLCFKTGRQQPTESYMLVIIESVNCSMHMYELSNSMIQVPFYFLRNYSHMSLPFGSNNPVGDVDRVMAWKDLRQDNILTHT